MERDGGGGGRSDVGSYCYYSVLGIRNDASFSDIRSAYRKLALNPAAAGEAKRRFQKIQEAYSVLSDTGKRSMYDAGFLDLFEKDEGMGDFLHDLMSMMEKNSRAKEESLEDLQKMFVDLFGDDLAEMMHEVDDPTVRERSRDCGSSARVASRRQSGA